MATKAELLSQAGVIRNEVVDAANTADRVGLMFEDFINTALADNFAAASAPTVTDDSSQGYEVGSLWYFGSNLFICLSNAIGAANWSVIWSGSAQTLTWVSSIAFNVASGLNATVSGTAVNSTIDMTNLKGGYRGRIAFVGGSGVSGEVISFLNNGAPQNVISTRYLSNQIVLSEGNYVDYVEYYYDGTRLFLTHMPAVQPLPKLVTANYEIQRSDCGRVLVGVSGSDLTFTMANDLPDGFVCTVIKGGAGNIVFSNPSISAAGTRITTQSAGANVIVDDTTIRLLGTLVI